MPCGQFSGPEFCSRCMFGVVMFVDERDFGRFFTDETDETL